MAALKLVILSLLIIQTAGSSSPLRGLAAGGSVPTSGGAGSTGASTGASIPAHDASEGRTSHHAKESTKSDSERAPGDPWSNEGVVALFTTLLVLYIFLGLGLSFGVYLCWKKRDSKTQEKASPEVTSDAEKEKESASTIGLPAEKAVADDVSTQPESQSGDMQAAVEANPETNI